MRVKLDPETVAFEEGYKAFGNGTPRTQNPYDKGELRTAWFEGWEHAQFCGGTCG